MSVESPQNMVYKWSFLSIAKLKANSTFLSTFIALQFPEGLREYSRSKKEEKTKLGDTSHHQKDRKEMDIKFLSYKTFYK